MTHLEVLDVKKSFPTTFIKLSQFDGLSSDECIDLLNSNGFITPKDNYNFKVMSSVYVEFGSLIIVGEKFCILYFDAQEGILNVCKRPSKKKVKLLKSDVPKVRIFINSSTVCHNPYGPAIISGQCAFYFIDGVLQDKKDILLKRIKAI